MIIIKFIIILKLIIGRLVGLLKKYLTASSRNRKRRGDDMDDPTKLFVFRPYKLIHVNYIDQNDGGNIPVARSGHRIACNDDNLFCLGGFNITQNRIPKLFKELWKFNRHTKVWTLIQDTNVPKESASTAMLLEGNLLMVFGGTGFPFGENCSNKFSICRTNRDPMSIKRIKTTGVKPEPLYGQNIIYHNQYMYAIGGTTGYAYFCDIHRLSLKTRRWETVYESRDEMPKGRYRHGVAYDGNLIYVLGGGTATESYDLIQIPAFDLKNITWKYVRTLPDESISPLAFPGARKCHTCTQYKTADDDIHVIITGGYDMGTYYDDIWRLSLKTYRWTLLQTATLPQPLYFHDATTSGDQCLYIFGGIKHDDRDNTRTNEVYKVWTNIPKLTAICWEAVLHYYPNIKNVKRSTLLENGIPAKYVQALQS